MYNNLNVVPKVFFPMFIKLPKIVFFNTDIYIVRTNNSICTVLSILINIIFIQKTIALLNINAKIHVLPNTLICVYLTHTRPTLTIDFMLTRHDLNYMKILSFINGNVIVFSLRVS